MSYILDALKKIEKERRRGRIPGLSEQDSIVYHSQRRPVWPYILIAVFLLNAALLVWWLLPKKPKDIVMPTVPSISQDLKNQEIREPDNAMTPAKTEPAPEKRPQVSPPAKETDYHERLLQIRKMLQEDAQKKTGLATGEPKAENDRQKEPESAPQEKKSEVVVEPQPNKKLYKFADLPPAVRDSLRKFFTITAYMYSSNPSERMVRINDHMMKEGQEIDPGIKIEEIVPDGVILSYKKFRFFVSVK